MMGFGVKVRASNRLDNSKQSQFKYLDGILAAYTCANCKTRLYDLHIRHQSAIGPLHSKPRDGLHSRPPSWHTSRIVRLNTSARRCGRLFVVYDRQRLCDARSLCDGRRGGCARRRYADDRFVGRHNVRADRQSRVYCADDGRRYARKMGRRCDLQRGLRRRQRVARVRILQLQFFIRFRASMMRTL